MTQEYSYQSNGIKQLGKPTEKTDYNQNPTIVVSPFTGTMQFQKPVPILNSICVRLDLEDLKCFEMVERQFQQWGVIFANAMAIHPSNPAFPPHSGNTVLIGAPKSGFLEATFTEPVSFVSGFVTSSRRAVLAAYDENGQPLAHAELPAANLAGSQASISPNVQLSLKAKNIYRVTFFSFDGHLTVDDFSFSH